jgi:hypothetical protein
MRWDLVPSSAIPIAYFAFAHLALDSALAALAVRPEIPGGFFYHPRMIALVHLLTLGWISGSILGAFYIVAPVALRMPLPAGRADWIAFTAFALGTIGMVAHFWIDRYDGVAWAALLVSAAMLHVAVRAARGLSAAPVPWAVKLHVRLAFFNITAAAAFGILIGLDRSRGFLGVLPLTPTYAHAHLAAVGWATMIVVGLSYRLIPMMLPAKTPSGPSLALSAVLIEAGLAVVVAGLLTRSACVSHGGGLIGAGLACFVWQIRRTIGNRVSRPPALPRHDWSVWQTHSALLWLLVALALGLVASTDLPSARRIGLIWVYGVAGLVGFLGQIVAGMQGRLVPMYAWYRAFAELRGAPPPRPANALPSSAFARAVFVLWAFGVPLLALGLAAEHYIVIRAAGVLLAAGVAVGGVYMFVLLHAASARQAELAPASLRAIV